MVTILLFFIFSVMTAAIREIEDNINKQIWSLPQELFRNHFQDAKYELVVEKYKGNNNRKKMAKRTLL
jgi:IS30 family transposase